MNTNNYDLLIKKLDEFIRKFYLNQVLRGAIYTIALILGLYLFISLMEYFFPLPTGGRQVLFFGFLLSSFTALGYWIGIPLFRYFRLGHLISHEKAAAIIGNHFKNIEDRLLNILQLKKQATNNHHNLIEASINQKIGDLKPVPFTAAINLGQNKRYIKYALLPMAIITFILLAAPNVLTESNKRLINNTRSFAPKAPFEFILANHSMEVAQYEDFDLELKIVGDKLPDQVIAEANDYTYKLNKVNSNTYTYKFRKLQKDLNLRFKASGFSSDEYLVKVLPKPMIVNFEVILDYPVYTQKKDEQLKNIGDVVVPAGTKINWRFITENTDDIRIKLAGDTLLEAVRTGDNAYSFNKMFLEEMSYKLLISNNLLNSPDSIGYTVSVIPDKHPMIAVEQFQDSLNNKQLYFLGEASDDYGLKNISFRYKHEKADATGAAQYETLPVKNPSEEKNTEFTYSWDLTTMNIEPGDVVKYYFIVWDNDGVYGSKYSKTATMTYQMPTYEEYKEMNKQSNDKLKDDMEKSMKAAQKLKDEMKALQEKLVQKKELSWEDKKAIKELMKKQKELQEQMSNSKENFNKNLEQQSEYSEQTEQIREKQQKLQEMFDEIMSEEMKQMMEELEKLLDEMNQEQALEELENMEISNEQIEKEMDRMMELFKQLEFEQKMNETLEELNKLAEEQKELEEKTKESDPDNEQASDELSKEQEKLNKKFEDIQKEMEELDKMNKEMENSQDFKNDKEKQEDIKKDMKESLDDLQQNKKQDATEKQKDAGEKMQEMSEQMSSMMSSMQMQQMQLDMEAISQLLENLIKLSFDQENLMDEIRPINTNSAHYTKLIQKQHKLKNDAKMVEDSLFALSKRVFQISTFVNKEIAAINKNMDESIELLAERKKPQALTGQQYVMTGMNNLALMLDEIMQQMQQQMASMMSGQQMCQAPMSGQQMQKMSEMQEQLNEQMKKMQGEMEGGEKSGKGGKGKGGMSKELAQMAAKQAAIRRAIEEMSKELGKEGGMGNLDKLAEEMEKTEEDIVNRRITQKMLERQQEILVRMLEAADAEKEREQSPERESQTAERISKNLPPSIEEYLKKRKAEVDLYKTVPPRLKPFYKNIVENYFESISKE